MKTNKKKHIKYEITFGEYISLIVVFIIMMYFIYAVYIVATSKKKIGIEFVNNVKY